MKPSPLQRVLARRLLQSQPMVRPVLHQAHGFARSGVSFVIRITRPNAPLSLLPRAGMTRRSEAMSAPRKPAPAT
jgi:hypothetical protein